MAFLSNNHVFRRIISWNPTICHNESLFIRVYSNFHLSCSKTTKRYENQFYPKFDGDLRTFKIKFPRVISTPLLDNPPEFLAPHLALSRISLSKLDNYVENLFPVTRANLANHDDWPASKKLLRAIVLASPSTKSSYESLSTAMTTCHPPPSAQPLSPPGTPN